MADQVSLREIFEEMDMNAEKVPLQLAEEWVNSRSHVYFKKIKYGKFAFDTKYTMNAWHKMTPFERGSLLTSFCQKIKLKEEFLTQILCYSTFNYTDSRSIVQHLQNQFNYFAQYTFLLEEMSSPKHIVDVQPIHFDMLIVGKIIAPILSSGFTVRIYSPEKFVHFFLALGELLEDSGLPLGVLTLTDHDDPDGNVNKISIRNPHPDNYCPVIVCEDADIDSAVDSITQGAWRFLGKVSWSITHAYIQEPIFKDVVNRLKTRSLKLKPGSHLIKYCEISEETDFEVKKMAGLEVFQPFKACPHCFYIGWDPLDYEDPSTNPRQTQCGVSLLPFRTLREAVALANRSRFGSAASLWTERISVAKKVSKALEFGTVWINSHGLFHPSIPFESKKESKFPINGKQLITALRNINIESSIDEGTNAFSWDKVRNEISASLFVSKDIFTAVERARNTQQIWIKCGREERFKKLCGILQVVEGIIQSEIRLELMTAIKYSLCNARFSEHSFVENLEEMDVTYSFQPFGIIWIIISNISPLILEQLVILIFSLLIYGNSIIISAKTDELKRIALHICGIFEKCNLQNGLLSFVNEPFDAQKLHEKGSNENRYCKIINRFITFGKTSFIFPLGQNVEFYQEGLDFCRNSDLLKFLAVQKTSVWVPNG